MPVKLTIGTATYDDFDGVWMTLQSLRLNHPDLMKEVELIVVDNKPNRKDPQQGGPEPDRVHSHAVQKFSWWLYNSAEQMAVNSPDGPPWNLGGYRYIPFEEHSGTATPRNLIFREARGKFVMVMDCHVLLPPESLKAAFRWIENNPDSKDILSGPMLYDGLLTSSSRFDPVWRDRMYGTWGCDWVCTCGERYGVHESNPDKPVEQRTVLFHHPYPNNYFGSKPGEYYTTDGLRWCSNCASSLPSVPWFRHEIALRKAGMIPIHELDSDVPHETWANGLGLFMARRQGWPEFSSKFRGFGGEEGYIHEKVRRAGGKSLCLPSLRWLHRFQRPVGVQYPHTQWNQMRNYVIGHTELGWDLAPIKEAFRGSMSDADLEYSWEALTENPSNPPALPQGGPHKRPVTFSPVVGQSPAGIEAAFEALKKIPHDFRTQEDVLKGLASESKVVVELGGRRSSSSVCLLAGQPQTLRIIDPNPEGVDRLRELQGQTTIEHIPMRSEEVQPIPCDLLLIDTNHTGEQLKKELDLYRDLADRIILHDTTLHLTQGENNKPGFLEVLKELVGGNGGWFVLIHVYENYGLTVFSRLQRERPAKKVHVWPPEYGPGTELMEMIKSLGITEKPGCDCKAKARQMDIWGWEECERRRDTIVGWIEEGSARWGWVDKVKAGWRSLFSGFFIKIVGTNYYANLVDEAIRRAKEKETNS